MFPFEKEEESICLVEVLISEVKDGEKIRGGREVVRKREIEERQTW